MRSSYAENNYAEVFAAIIDGWKPVRCVELGVLDGYSAIAIGKALKKVGRGELVAYDLFEDYPFKHGNFAEVSALIEANGLSEIVKLKAHDAWAILDTYSPESIDLLHVDLSNTGDTVRRVMEQWDSKMVCGGIILFEGGTEERDQVEWMIKYDARPMKPEFENNNIIKEKYIYATYLKFPGLTMLLKKR